VLRCRTFNIIGPRQAPGFVSSDFARQVVRIERGLEERIIHVGNLESQRDFVDVRDVVHAYYLVMGRGQLGRNYNVCSGQARSIYSLLEGMLALSIVDKIDIRQERARLQKADVPLQVGDYARLHQQTGWQPRISFEQSLRDLLDYWRGQV
jgi:GDP-4-dehydro-6-deoxy-D-mannose reductase